MNKKIYKVLFLCTGNSARSIMAEALLNTKGQGQFRAFSAGSHPTGVVNPWALEQVQKTAYPSALLRSKSFSEFAQNNAADTPQMDFVITVCANAAGEVCPLWPGQPISAHWEFADPASVQGSDEEKRQAFEQVYRQIEARIDALLSLPLSLLEKDAIEHALNRLSEPTP